MKIECQQTQCDAQKCAAKIRLSAVDFSTIVFICVDISIVGLCSHQPFCCWFGPCSSLRPFCWIQLQVKRHYSCWFIAYTQAPVNEKNQNILRCRFWEKHLRRAMGAATNSTFLRTLSMNLRITSHVCVSSTWCNLSLYRPRWVHVVKTHNWRSLNSQMEKLGGCENCVLYYCCTHTHTRNECCLDGNASMIFSFRWTKVDAIFFGVHLECSCFDCNRQTLTLLYWWQMPNPIRKIDWEYTKNQMHNIPMNYINFWMDH